MQSELFYTYKNVTQSAFFTKISKCLPSPPISKIQ